MSLVGELLLHFKSVAPGRYNFMVLVGIGYTGGQYEKFSRIHVASCSFDDLKHIYQ